MSGSRIVNVCQREAVICLLKTRRSGAPCVIPSFDIQFEFQKKDMSFHFLTPNNGLFFKVWMLRLHRKTGNK